jgi:hypothetical protein
MLRSFSHLATPKATFRDERSAAVMVNYWLTMFVVCDW